MVIHSLLPTCLPDLTYICSCTVGSSYLDFVTVSFSLLLELTLPQPVIPQISTWIISSHSLVLYSSTIFPERPSLTNIFKPVTSSSLYSPCPSYPSSLSYFPLWLSPSKTTWIYFSLCCLFSHLIVNSMMTEVFVRFTYCYNPIA